MGWLKGVLRKATGGEEEDIHRRRMERMTADRDTLPDAELVESDCRYRETAHHGLPPAPSTIAVDSFLGLVAIGTKHGAVKVLGREGVERLLRVEVPAPVSCLAFAEGMGVLCAGSDAPAIYVWNLKDEPGRDSWRCITLKSFPTCLHCPPGAPFLYAGTSEGELLFARLPGAELAAYSVSADDLGCVHVAPPATPTTVEGPREVVACESLPVAATQVLVGLREGVLVLWDMERRRARRLLGGGVNLSAARPSPDGRLAAAGYASGEILVWALVREREPLLRLAVDPAGGVLGLAWGGAEQEAGRGERAKERPADMDRPLGGVSLVMLVGRGLHGPGRLVVRSGMNLGRREVAEFGGGVSTGSAPHGEIADGEDSCDLFSMLEVHGGLRQRRSEGRWPEAAEAVLVTAEGHVGWAELGAGGKFGRFRRLPCELPTDAVTSVSLTTGLPVSTMYGLLREVAATSEVVLRGGPVAGPGAAGAGGQRGDRLQLGTDDLGPHTRAEALACAPGEASGSPLGTEQSRVYFEDDGWLEMAVGAEGPAWGGLLPSPPMTSPAPALAATAHASGDVRVWDVRTAALLSVAGASVQRLRYRAIVGDVQDMTFASVPAEVVSTEACRDEGPATRLLLLLQGTNHVEALFLRGSDDTEATGEVPLGRLHTERVLLTDTAIPQSAAVPSRPGVHASSSPSIQGLGVNGTVSVIYLEREKLDLSGRSENDREGCGAQSPRQQATGQNETADAVVAQKPKDEGRNGEGLESVRGGRSGVAGEVESGDRRSPVRAGMGSRPPAVRLFLFPSDECRHVEPFDDADGHIGTTAGDDLNVTIEAERTEDVAKDSVQGQDLVSGREAFQASETVDVNQANTFVNARSDSSLDSRAASAQPQTVVGQLGAELSRAEQPTNLASSKEHRSSGGNNGTPESGPDSAGDGQTFQSDARREAIWGGFVPQVCLEMPGRVRCTAVADWAGLLVAGSHDGVVAIVPLSRGHSRKEAAHVGGRTAQALHLVVSASDQSASNRSSFCSAGGISALVCGWVPLESRATAVPARGMASMDAAGSAAVAAGVGAALVALDSGALVAFHLPSGARLPLFLPAPPRSDPVFLLALLDNDGRAMPRANSVGVAFGPPPPSTPRNAFHATTRGRCTHLVQHLAFFLLMLSVKPGAGAGAGAGTGSSAGGAGYPTASFLLAVSSGVARVARLPLPPSGIAAQDRLLQVATRIAATGAVVVTHRGEPALALWDGAGQLCLLSLLQLRPLLSVSLQEAHPLLPRSALHFTSVAADGRMLLAAPTSFGSSNGSPSSALFRASLFRDENALQLPALAARLVRSDLGAPTLAMTHRPSPMAATKGLVRGLLAATGLGRELAGSTPARNTCPLAALLAPQSSVTPRQAAGNARDGPAGDARGAACPREELFAGRTRGDSAAGAASKGTRGQGTEQTREIAGAATAAAEARDLLVERGEKLSELRDKSARLEDSAQEFHEMIRRHNGRIALDVPNLALALTPSQCPRIHRSWAHLWFDFGRARAQQEMVAALT